MREESVEKQARHSPLCSSAAAHTCACGHAVPALRRWCRRGKLTGAAPDAFVPSETIHPSWRWRGTSSGQQQVAAWRPGTVSTAATSSNASLESLPGTVVSIHRPQGAAQPSLAREIPNGQAGQRAFPGRACPGGRRIQLRCVGVFPLGSSTPPTSRFADRTQYPYTRKRKRKST